MTTPQQSTARKVLSVIGLLALIVLVAWLAISFIRILPTAVTSLASLADSVYHPQQTVSDLDISTQSNIVNVDEEVTITWNELDQDGSYVFSYQCNDSGVALNTQLRDGAEVTLDCSAPFVINQNSIVITAESAKQRFVDVTYSVTFTPNDSDKEPMTETSRLTIVNPDISTGVATSTEEESEEVPAETETPPATTPNTPNQPTGQTSTVVEEAIYALPQSDPNGSVDLQVRHLSVGELTGNTFTARGEISTDMLGAFQFVVKNIGTKTASNWSYEATLPNGSTYESGNQTALRPNEEAVITLGFTAYDETGIQTIGAEVSAPADINTSNNSYSWVMTIVD